MQINRIKEIREDNDLKQIEIAKLLNVTQAQYSRYELGVNTIPIEKIVILAQFYNTSTDYLLSLTDERIPYKRTILENKKSKITGLNHEKK